MNFANAYQVLWNTTMIEKGVGWVMGGVEGVAEVKIGLSFYKNILKSTGNLF